MKILKTIGLTLIVAFAASFNINAIEAVDGGDARWAQVRVSVACMRTNPGHSSELCSQAVMGTPVKILEEKGEWCLAKTPEGYTGWIIDNSLVEKSAAEMDNWREDKNRVVVTSLDQSVIYRNSVDKGIRDRLSDAVNGSIVELIDTDETGMANVKLPDGRNGWIAKKNLSTIQDWANQEYDGQKILDLAYSMEGLPYLWGGTSIKSVDCSGLTRVAYYNNGIIITRDASQQAVTGERIEAADWRTLEAGDLLFFGNANTQKVTHVAIYDNNGDYVHSSGRVKRNSVDPESDSYLTTPFLWAVKIHGSEGTDGIIKVANHPWYFDQK